MESWNEICQEFDCTKENESEHRLGVSLPETRSELRLHTGAQTGELVCVAECFGVNNNLDHRFS